MFFFSAPASSSMNIQSELLLAKSRLLLSNSLSSFPPVPAHLDALAARSNKFLSSISFLVPKDLGSRFLSEKGLSLLDPKLSNPNNPTLIEEQPFCHLPSSGLLSASQFCDEANDGQLGETLVQTHKCTLSKAQKACKLASKQEWQEKRQNLGLYSISCQEAFSLDSYYAPLLVCYAHIVKQMNMGKLSVAEGGAVESFLFHAQSFCSEKKYEPIVGIWRLLVLVASSSSCESASLVWLQERYAEHIDQTVAQHPRAMRPGSSQSVLERVMCYSRIFIQSALDSSSPSIAIGECVEPRPGAGEVSFWAVLYFLIRIGNFSEAISWCCHPNSPLAATGNQQNVLREILINWLREGSKPQSIPKSAFEGPLDTFKSLILRLLAPSSSASASSSSDQEFMGLEEERKRKSFSSILNRTECYLWFQFRISNNSDDDHQALASHFLGLGSNYFGSGCGAVLVYSLVLMLLSRWNDALGALMEAAPEFRVDAIHMGICLWALGKITPIPTFSAVASKWLLEFEGGDLAIQYPVALMLGIGGDLGKKQELKDKVEDQLAFIVGHSNDLFTLLGSGNGDGGALQALLSAPLDLGRVLGKAGSFCLRAGRETQATQLFHAAKKPQKVVELLVKRGKRLLLSVGGDDEVDQFIRQATGLYEYYQRSLRDQSKECELRPLQVALGLLEASALGKSCKWQEALAKIHSLNLLPPPSSSSSNDGNSKENDSMAMMMVMRERANNLHTSIFETKILDSSMLECLLIWVQMAHLKLATSSGGGVKWKMQQKSRELVAFAGMLREDALTSHVYARLCALDSEIAAL